MGRESKKATLMEERQSSLFAVAGRGILTLSLAGGKCCVRADSERLVSACLEHSTMSRVWCNLLEPRGKPTLQELLKGGAFALLFYRLAGDIGDIGVLVEKLADDQIPEESIDPSRPQLLLLAPSAPAALAARYQREVVDEKKPDSLDYQSWWDKRDAARSVLVQKYQAVLPEAVWLQFGTDFSATQFKRVRADTRLLAEAIEAALTKRGFSLAWNGRYEADLVGHLLIDPGIRVEGLLVRYQPRGAQARYPELLEKAKELLPKAFRKTLISVPPLPRKSQRPLVSAIDLDLSSDLGELDYPELAQTDFFDSARRANRRKTVLRRVAQSGTDALACYGSHHEFEPGSWGIVLDDLCVGTVAGELTERLRPIGGSFLEAMKVVLWLVWEHEFFHARLDAFCTLQEVASMRPGYRRYLRKVYKPNHCSPECLEEALANFVAREAVSERLHSLLGTGAWTMELVNETMAFVDDFFAGSPPGYSDWAKGADPDNWRRLAAEVLSGKPTQGVEALAPVEGLLRDLPGIVLLPEDVPVFITCFTELGRSLFGSPSRKEATRVLRHLGCTLDCSGGKGSHEKWKRPGASRPWTMPSRDPMSVGVFRTLLHFLDIDKKAYMQLRMEV